MKENQDFKVYVAHDPSGESGVGKAIDVTVRKGGNKVASMFAESPQEYLSMSRRIERAVLMAAFDIDTQSEELPSIADYLSESLALTLSRRQVFVLRSMVKTKLKAAKQAVDNPSTSPRRREVRTKEYLFFSKLLESLYDHTQK